MNHWLELHYRKWSDTLYDFMLDYLDHNRCCLDCGERMWAGYTDGHVWDVCLGCDEPTKKFKGDIAGYITNYPVPSTSLPDCIEVREIDPRLLEHERYYRKVKK